MSSEKLVLGLTGMPGSGKSLIVDAARSRDYDVVVMGDIIREESAKRNLAPNAENIGKTMLDLRQTEGSNIIAIRCIPKIENAAKQKVIVDGIRSLDEVEEFKIHFPKFSLIAIHTSPEVRFNRLYRRHRSDDADGWGVFHERDLRELGVGIGNAIAMAEHMIVNEESLGTVKEKIRETLGKVEQKWMK